MGKTKNIIQVALTILLLFVMFCGQTVHAESKDDKMDYLSLAALLIKDGFYERAETVLINIDIEKLKKETIEEENNVQLIKYYTFYGLVMLKKKNYQQASVYFDKAIKNGSKDTMVKVYLIYAYYGLHNFKKTVLTVEHYPDVLKKYKLYGIYAQSLWNLKMKKKAFSVIHTALEKYPAEKAFVRQELFFLIGLGLYQTALVRAQEFLLTEELSKEDYITIGRAFRKAGQPKKALTLLERGMLIYPHDNSIKLELSGCYHDTSMNYTAAVLMERAALQDPSLTPQAAELYRRAKRYVKALFLNMSIDDQKEKLKQRLAYYLETGEYESVVAMFTDASRAGLLENEDIIYAFAYSFFITGHFDDCEMLIARITRSDLFRKAAELRKSIKICKENPKSCI